MTVFEEAIRFATEAHSGQRRRRENTPYILHPLEVAAIVGTMSADEELLAAAVLHDTVEDTAVTAEEILARFGPRVAALVAAETENKREELPPEETWLIRKQESLEELRQAEDPAVKLLWLGDKLSNMRSFHRNWKKSGNDLWKSLHQPDPAMQAWYYHSIDVILEDLRDYDAWQEYHTLVEIVFEGVKEYGKTEL